MIWDSVGCNEMRGCTVSKCSYLSIWSIEISILLKVDIRIVNGVCVICSISRAYYSNKQEPSE